jgi:SEC-C motif
MLAKKNAAAVVRYTSLMTAQSSARPGRNEPCHCGSGRKYKHCCLDKDNQEAAAARAKAAEETPAQASEAAASTRKRPPKPQTEQPWKAKSTRGFVSRPRMPRKVGGS